MSIIEDLVRLFAPHVCIGCGTEDDALLCVGCSQSLPRLPSRCYNCANATTGFAVCTECGSRSALTQVAASVDYSGVPQQLVHRAKFERAQAGLKTMAAVMAELLTQLPQDAILVPVPTASSRVRSRGYDHAALLARWLSRSSGLPYAKLLTRVGQAHQVGANRHQRLEQLTGAFRVVNPERVVGRNIILVDDVLTTGASLEQAARALHRRNPARVDGLVFAHRGL